MCEKSLLVEIQNDFRQKLAGTCKNGTGNRGTNGKVGQNGTPMLNFSKLKPQTFHRKPPTFELQTPTP